MAESPNMTQEQVMKMLYERNEQLAKELQALRMEQQQALVHLNNSKKEKGLKPPSPEVFKGHSVDTFLFSVEKAFEFYEIDESRKVTVAVNYFRDSALRWFKFMERRFQVSPPSWQTFKELLIQHFKASNTETVIRNKLNSLRQIGSVVSYNDAFNRLIIELPDIDENTKIDMYCRGLKSQVQLQVRLRSPDSLHIAQTTALNVDHIIGAMNYSKGKSFPASSRSFNEHPRSTATSSSNNSAPMELGNTEEVEDASEELGNHVSALSSRYQGSNRLGQEEIRQLIKEKKCFKCKKTGHIARRCPNVRKINM